MGLSLDSNLITTLAVIFTTGLLGGLSPCTLPTVVLVVGYVSGYRDSSRKRGFFLSLFFVLGIAFTLSMLGAFAGLIGRILQSTTILNYMIAIILGIMGLWMFGVIDLNMKYQLKGMTPKKGSGLIGAFILGIPFGIAASPCTLPITASVLAYSASKGSAIYGMTLMFTYAIGRSIPLLVVGTFTGLLKNIRGIEKFQGYIEKVGGIILLLLALYFVWKA
jgi:cytochrome c-type biogenesis protein